MNLGKAIKLCRNYRGFTQTQLGERCKLTVSYISLLEVNKRDPSFSTFRLIAAALDMPPTLLVFLAEPVEMQRFSPVLADLMRIEALKVLEKGIAENASANRD